MRITYFMNWPLDYGTGFRHADLSSIDDCFGKNWQYDAQAYLAVSGGGLIPDPYHANVHPIVLSQSHNIGEPIHPDSSINPNTGYPDGQRFLELSTGGALQSELIDPNSPIDGRRYFEFPPAPLDGGREYWHEPPSGFYRFCGFLCRSTDQRHSNGDCDRGNVDIHPGYSESFNDSVWSAPCASSLRGMLDSTPSNLGYPPNPSTTSGLTPESCVGRSCTSRNFAATAMCQCDEACHHIGDCCVDKVAVCGDFVATSCEGKCGRRWTDRSHTCSCSYDCVTRGDCCQDAQSLCPAEISTPSAHSCTNRCGYPQDSYFTCACDHLCASRGDCCIDKTQACPITPSTVLGSCAGTCGPTAGSAYGGMCFCDSGCVDRGDCCMDAGMLCDVQLNGSSFPMVPGGIVDRIFCSERPAACRAVENMYSIDINWP